MEILKILFLKYKFDIISMMMKGFKKSNVNQPEGKKTRRKGIINSV